MIDAHCHLDEFEDVDSVISTAKSQGVSMFLSCGGNMSSSHQAVEISENYPEVYAAVGLGYSTRERNLEHSQQELIHLARQRKVIAIGECGLDYPEGTTDEEKQSQRELLKMHVAVAQQTNLPVVVHSRHAHQDILKIIPEGLSVQCHCFTGDMEQMQQCVDHGWYISFGGIVTFKKSDYLREVVKKVPQDRLLLETDSPYLSPEPIRRERNQPANVRIVAELVAQLRGVSLPELNSQTTANAFRLFSKLTT